LIEDGLAEVLDGAHRCGALERVFLAGTEFCADAGEGSAGLEDEVMGELRDLIDGGDVFGGRAGTRSFARCVGEERSGILSVVEKFAGAGKLDFARELFPIVGGEGAFYFEDGFDGGEIVDAAEIDAAESESSIDCDLSCGEFAEEELAFVGGSLLVGGRVRRAAG
jgi:hypothetical protein